MRAIWSKLPLASFTPTMLGTRDRRSVVSAVMFVPVRPGMLYMMQGRLVERAMASKWR